MTIRKTTVQDIDSVLSLYEETRSFMKENGNGSQWQDGYPSKETLKEDIQANGAFVCTENEQIVGTFAYYYGDKIEPSYNQINGAWLDDKPYGVIHRISTKRGTHGVGRFCMDWAFAQCGRMRIDTHKENIPMQNLIKKCGFVYCGIITLLTGDKSERIAFMKANQEVK